MVARAGAVVGRCFSPDVLAGVVDLLWTSFEPIIDELVAASILYPFDYIDQGYYDFRHQLLRDAIYGACRRHGFRRFHAQAAEFVTSLEASSVVHAARHYDRAGLRPQAFQASMTAASRPAGSPPVTRHSSSIGAIDNMPADLPVGEQAELYERYADSAGAIEHNEAAAAAAAPGLYLKPAGRSMRRAS